MSDPTYKALQRDLAPPSLLGPKGTAFLEAHGEEKDAALDRARLAVLARIIEKAPEDALMKLGAERGLARYPGELVDVYRQRVLKAWEAWEKAGTDVGIIEQLQVVGFTTAQVFALYREDKTRWAEFMVTVAGRYLDPHELATLPAIVKAFKPAEAKLAGMGLGTFEMWEDDGFWGDDAYWGGYHTIAYEEDIYDTQAEWQQGTFSRCIATPAGTVVIDPALVPTLSRTSAAYDSVGNSYAAGVPRFDTGSLGVRGTVNLWVNSEPTTLAAFNSNSGVAATTGVSSSLAGGVYFAGDGVLKWAYQTNIAASNTSFVISCFVRMDDGSAPVAGASTDATRDLSFVIGNTTVVNYLVIPTAETGLYRVIGILTTGVIGTNTTGIIKRATHSTRGFKATGFQLEFGTEVTDYLQTIASAATRAPQPGTSAILIEESATTLFSANAQNFTTGWTAGAGSPVVTVTPNQPDPWGGNTAYRIQVTGGTSTQKYFYSLVAPSVNAAKYSIGAWIKNNSATQIWLNASLPGAVAAVTQAEGWKETKVENITGNGVTNLQFDVRANASGDSLDYCIVLPRAEPKAYLTSYVLPGTTRNAEALSLVTTPSVLNINQGSLIIRAYVGGDLRNTAMAFFRHLFTAGIGSNRIYMFRSSTSKAWTMETRDDAGNSSQAIAAALDLAEGFHIFGGTWDSTKITMWVDGQKRGTNNTPKLPTTQPLSAGIGGLTGGSGQWGMPIDSLHIFEEVLSDALMTQYTTTPPSGLTDKSTLFLPFNGNLVPEVRAIWTGPWRPNRIQIPKKTIVPVTLVPAGTSLTIDHRSNSNGVDAGASAWAAQGATPDNDLFQTRAVLVGKTNLTPELQRLAISPV